jgi:uncharacterized protein (TIGR00369 family)
MMSAVLPENPHSQADLLEMSGLDFMRGILNGERAGAPIARTLGYRLHEVEDGRVSFRGAPSVEVTNPTGSVHGGWYGTLLDSAMACAVMTKVPKGSVYTTLEYKINITRSIPVGMEIECTGWVDHAGRTTGVAHGEVRGLDDSKLYATGSTTCIILKM